MTRRVTQVELVLTALGIKHTVKGSRAWALCPFHEDHNPSWFIRLRKGPYAGHHCFSCKKGGTLAELVEHVRGCDEKEAKAFVEDCGRGYEPPRARVRVVERPAVIGRRRFALPREAVLAPLEEWPGPARSYAAVDRHITAEQVERFGLGYAVEGRLAGRIVFPCRGPGGRIGSYSARSFAGEEPRYLTPHASEGYLIDAVFGEHLWPDRRPEVVVVEGAINALAVDRATSCPVAALGGSHVGEVPLQVAKLATFARVTLLTDPDKAGNEAAAAIRSVLARYVEDIVRVKLPAGKDADDMPAGELAAMLSRAPVASAS